MLYGMLWYVRLFREKIVKMIVAQMRILGWTRSNARKM